MRLKNKKTGEIGYFCFANWDSPVLIIMDKNGVQLAKYNSLAELNEEWEDVPEEPKDFWFIDPEILIACESTDPLLCDKKVAIGTMKLIGNYFETKEEAEKAVEKLKAWKRLKDKGISLHLQKQFRGDGIGYSRTIYTDFTKDSQEIVKDLDLLFGGEK